MDVLEKVFSTIIILIGVATLLPLKGNRTRSLYFLLSIIGGAILIYQNMGVIFIPILITILVSEVLLRDRKNMRLWNLKNRNHVYLYCLLVPTTCLLVFVNLYRNGSIDLGRLSGIGFGLTEVTITFLTLVLTHISFRHRGDV